MPLADIEIPIYLDKDVAQYLMQLCQTNPDNLQMLVNDLLRKDIVVLVELLCEA